MDLGISHKQAALLKDLSHMTSIEASGGFFSSEEEHFLNHLNANEALLEYLHSLSIVYRDLKVGH